MKDDLAFLLKKFKRLQKFWDAPASEIQKLKLDSNTRESIIRFRNEISPRLAIIQVGKNNYGHPTKEVIDLLTSKAVKILRNDTNGIIEITSDGRSFKAKSEK